jgi:hypothetical protein
MRQGTLFTRDFLDEGVLRDPAWAELSPDRMGALRQRLAALFAGFPTAGRPNEAVTEKDLIHPILEALGWSDMLVQQAAAARGREDVPDVLLFADAASKAAGQAGHDPYRHGLAIVESKRWARPLDRAGAGAQSAEGVPAAQMLRYLSRAETMSERRIQWGVLTDGRLWRLYFQGARSRSEEFLEIDLGVLVDAPGCLPDIFSPPPDKRDHWLRLFALFFGRAGSRPGAHGRTLHRRALDEGRAWETRVAADLGRTVFETVFPQLADALVRYDRARGPLTPARLAEARDAALTLLYRLLFVLYAEDRDLLPVRDPRYDDYSLRRVVRDRVAERIDRGDAFGARVGPIYDHCRMLFRVIDEGDPAIGIPPYNGGLFDPGRHPLLDRATLPDAVFAPLIDGLSRRAEGGRMLNIHYRDLSVQQLGSIYERLLEFELEAVEDPHPPDTLTLTLPSLRAGPLPLPQAGEGMKSAPMNPSPAPRERGGAAQREGEGLAPPPPAPLVRVAPNAFARKTSGSYYTPESLVRLILERTLRPLLEERVQAFRDAAKTLETDPRPPEARRAALAPYDPAASFLDLKICDPAMGSGHFLVSLVDFLADEALQAMADAPAAVPWAADPPWRSPLLDRIADIRTRIAARAAAEGWIIGEGQLDDRPLIRRMILKRVVHGVDKNPMAVELAKLALWLHTFTVGAPLSFLDHHLRAGDSLFGETVRGAMDMLRARGGLLINRFVQRAEGAADSMALIEATTDADIAEARNSALTFVEVEARTAPLRALFDLVHAERWLGVFATAPKRDPRPEAAKNGHPADPAALAAWDRAQAMSAFLDGRFGDPVAIAEGRQEPLSPEAVNQPDLLGGATAHQPDMMRPRAVDAAAHAALGPLLASLRALAAEQRFLHWEAAFPNVWRDWSAAAPSGGFDAVIGNPPWDRLKLQQVEWFASRRPDIAMQQRASDRKRMIAALEEVKDPLYHAYRLAEARAESASAVARGRSGNGNGNGNGNGSGGKAAYPLLSGGDVNLYSLFIERAQQLLASDGVAGLLAPSGIAADKTSSAFFGGMATAGRIGALLDFENRRPDDDAFFPDVDGRFKFCVFVVGGRDRRFAQTDCAFFLHDTAETADPDRVFALTAADFALVNPNTGTAPIFRTARDAEIAKAIYRRLPVLVDRRVAPPRAVWPVRYATMFHMTNDSGLFRTRPELDGEGFYPVAGNRLKRGIEEFVPLYEGKMVQAFDHRAANIVVNPANLHRPAQEEPATDALKADPAWLPNPQFFVSRTDIDWPAGSSWAIAFKDVTSPTNMRTMIAAVVPVVAAGNTLPLLFVQDPEKASLLLGNLNAIALDYVARQKVQSVHLNWYIVEQLPMVPDAGYDRRFGDRPARDMVRAEVLRLTYTAHDMAPFARDLGYEGPPFAWDETERRHARARLDALYFHLYGLDWDDADYILGAFPIVEREDRARFGRYLTRDLIRGYFHAFAAGDVETRIELA